MGRILDWEKEKQPKNQNILEWKKSNIWLSLKISTKKMYLQY
mgnify:CR=1 FL=1